MERFKGALLAAHRPSGGDVEQGGRGESVSENKPLISGRNSMLMLFR
eukprot:SAG11_NODE_13831_length_637_cov_1.245353_1_plen_46_part_10